jgi:hypothetical protein
MAIIKGKLRKKLAKTLGKIVKRHGAEMALALATGIVTKLASDAKPVKKPKRAVRTIVIRKRAPVRASR